MTAAATIVDTREPTRTTIVGRTGGPGRSKGKRVALHVFLGITAFLWIAPVLWAAYAALRPYNETQKYGYLSFPRSLTLKNFTDAWSNADIPHYLKNSFLIAIPAVILTLFLSSMVAFAVSRYSSRFNIALLILFTAGNLLPPQIIITPLYHMYIRLPFPSFLASNGHLYDSFYGLILIHVAFQTGFCVFVLSNYMRTIPHELTEAALVDGAGVWRQYWQLTMPLCRPAMAALATLLFTWIYNDFFWALVLMKTGSKRPITTAINNLSGQFFTDYNLVAAGSLLIALPTIAIFFALQKQFIAGLTLGANKG